MQRRTATSRTERGIAVGRRQAIRFLGAGLAMSLAGCCCARTASKPAIEEAGVAQGISPLLVPERINKRLTRDVFCVDVHAHFFNASDVTVKGFVEGPVAHAAGGDQGRLMKLLAP